MPVIPREAFSENYPDAVIRTWARVVRLDQTTALLRSDVTNVKLDVFKRPSATPTTPIYQDSLISPTTVMETAAQTDEDWPDEDGYTFKADFVPTDYAIEASSGSQLVLRYTLETIDGPMVVKHTRKVLG